MRGHCYFLLRAVLTEIGLDECAMWRPAFKLLEIFSMESEKKEAHEPYLLKLWSHIMNLLVLTTMQINQNKNEIIKRRKSGNMMKIRAAPKWRLTSSRSPLSSKSSVPITVSAGPMTIRQTLLPRSLDVSFEFKYRR